MMNNKKLYSFLSGKLVGVDVYSDFKPEKSPFPAVVYNHIASPFTRDLNGGKSQRYDTWRLTLFASTDAELEALVNQMESFDNVRESGYKRVFVIYNSYDPQQSEEQDYVRATVDIQTYEG